MIADSNKGRGHQMQVHKIVTPVYVNDLESTIAYYEEFLNKKVTNRFSYKEKGLDIAVIDTLLIIAGNEEALKSVNSISLSILVDNIKECRQWLLAHGATIVEDITNVPTGFNMIVQQPDNLTVEIVEHVKH
ncbi:VOC family protein [Lacrimispora sp.]|uniref:VOC family protein n=1 Tax=Lacrimispora sp. TaxID=2719234 RepID=UPI0028AAA50B|nr:VOC family protein [Lacrimispora sp.]